MEKLKAALAQKITSKEQFDEILRSVNPRNTIGRAEMRDDNRNLLANRVEYADARYVYEDELGRGWTGFPQLSDSPLYRLNPMVGVAGQSLSGYHHTRWWLLREHLRMALNWPVSCSDAMSHTVLRFPELAIHKKADDEEPSVVWFTPDAAAGERDAPVRTTLARLLRKLYPQESDEAIRNLDEAHRAELNNEIEFVYGMDIPDAYVKGPSSCMSYFTEHWGSTLNNHHPTEVYDAPGFALAINRSGERINARCLVWVNPDNPQDKRYVRNYGDGALERKLKRAGYRLAGLAGTRIKAVVLDTDTGSKKYLAPFIDYPGGKSGELAGRTLVRDGDLLRVLGDSLHDPVYKAFTNLGIRVGATGGTPGFAWVDNNHDMERLSITCPITGLTFTPDANSRTVLIDGALRTVHSTADLDGYFEAQTLGPDHRRVTVLVHPDTEVFTIEEEDWPVKRTLAVVDTTDNRQDHGFLQADPDLYPTLGWVRKDLLTKALKSLDPRVYGLILKTDVVDLIRLDNNSDPVRSPAHKSLVGAGYKKAHRMNSSRLTFVAPGVSTAKTPSGRTVVRGVHDVHERIDGVADFTRNLRQEYHMGVSMYTADGVSFDHVIAKVRKEMTSKFKIRVEGNLAVLRDGTWTRERTVNECWWGLGIQMRSNLRWIPVLRENHAFFEPYHKYVAVYLASHRRDTITDGGAREKLQQYLAACDMMARDIAAGHNIGAAAVGHFNDMRLHVEGVAPALREAIAAFNDDALDAIAPRPAPAAEPAPTFVTANAVETNSVRFTVAA